MSEEKINLIDFIDIHNEEQERIALKQYEILVLSLDQLNALREASNNFWIRINILIISAIAYLLNVNEHPFNYRSMIVWTLWPLGILLIVLWIRSLLFIKKSIDIRNFFLIGIEQNLPVKIFTASIEETKRYKSRRSLTLNEALVPLLFLLVYIFFAVFAQRIISAQGECCAPMKNSITST